MAKIKAKISLSRSSLEHRTKVTLLSATEITHVNHVLLDLSLIKKSQLFSFSFSYGHSGCFIIITNILRSTTAAAFKIKIYNEFFQALSTRTCMNQRYSLPLKFTEEFMKTCK